MDWNAIREEFISCSDSAREFAEKHPGVPLSTLKKKCAAGKWMEERNRFGTERDKLVREKNLEDAVRQAASVNELWTKLAELTRASMKTISGHAPAAALEHYANTIEKLQKGLFIRDPADLEEQKLRIERMRKEIAEKDSNVNEVTVELGGAEEWAN